MSKHGNGTQAKWNWNAKMTIWLSNLMSFLSVLEIIIYKANLTLIPLCSVNTFKHLLPKTQFFGISCQESIIKHKLKYRSCYKQIDTYKNNIATSINISSHARVKPIRNHFYMNVLKIKAKRVHSITWLEVGQLHTAANR